MDLQTIEEYCIKRLNRTTSSLPYHSKELIQNKIDFLKELAINNKIIKENIELLNAAIWLNYTAFVLKPLEKNKELLACIDELGDVVTAELKTFLTDHITQPNEGLFNTLNLSYTFSVNSSENLKNIRAEEIHLPGKSFNDHDWIDEQFVQLKKLKKSNLTFNKAELDQQDIAESKLKEMLLKYQDKLSKQAAKELHLDKEELKQLTKKLKKVEGIPERGIESWFRLASKNLYVRLKIVDTKAGILITSNSLIISIVLGSLYPQLDSDPHLIYAVATLIITCTLSLVYAILAAKPRLIDTLTKTGETDLMTFEYFHKLSLNQYKDGIKEIMESGDSLYSSITTDIYQLGQKLNRKYKLIGISFSIMLYGIIAAVIMFGLCHLIGLDGIT